MATPERTVSPGTASVLALNLVRYLIGPLVEKGVLTEAEVANILRVSLEDIREDQRHPARDLLTLFWPDLRA